MKVVIIGARKELEPLEFLFVPQTDPDGLEAAREKYLKALEQADEVWFFNKNAGEDTWRDFTLALERNKLIRDITITTVGGDKSK